MGAVALILIGREAAGWLWLFDETGVVYTDGCPGTVLAPPLDDFLEKRVFWTSGKEVAIKVACLRIKQNENWHRRRFWEWRGVHCKLIFSLLPNLLWLGELVGNFFPLLKAVCFFPNGHRRCSRETVLESKGVRDGICENH